MNIEYKNRLVAFIDVLGIKNLVYTTELQPIETYYEFILANFTTAVARRSFDFLMISDSIVIYCDASAANLAELIKLTATLQAGLLSKEILVRGAISHGGLFVDKTNNIVVGKGLISAYSLEAAARFPRIIIDRTLIKEYYGSTEMAMVSNAAGRAGTIKYLSTVPHNGGSTDHLYVNYGYIFAGHTAKPAYERALSLLKSGYYKNEHIEKFEWLKQYLIWSLESSIKYFSSKDAPSKNEKNKLRHNRTYLDLFRLL
jgi:hypothetical protein